MARVTFRASSGRSTVRRARQVLAQPVRPPLAALRDEIGEALGMCGARVECLHVLETLTTGTQERLAVLDGDLLERLQTIDREAGAHHGDFTHSVGGHGGEHTLCFRLEPLSRAEARLKAHAPLALLQ